MSQDGSGKCNAFYAGIDEDVVYGALSQISAADKPKLDSAERLGYVYEQKEEAVINCEEGSVTAIPFCDVVLKSSSFSASSPGRLDTKLMTPPRAVGP